MFSLFFYVLVRRKLYMLTVKVKEVFGMFSLFFYVLVRKKLYMLTVKVWFYVFIIKCWQNN